MSSTTSPADRPELLEGQTALVTGANSGLGTGIVRSLADCGADVVVNYIDDEQSAEEIADEVRARECSALTHRANIADEQQVQSMFQRSVEHFGTVDILVNNAGIQQDAAFDEMTLEQWNSVIDVNLTGHFLCAREAVREFKRRGVNEEVSCAAGKIIFITSVHDRIPWTCHANYAASKGGAQMLMKTIAQETAEDRIRTNAVAPGAIKTPINEEAWTNEKNRRQLLELIPYGRVGEVDDIGRAVAWLASDDSDYITGSTILVDGGMTLFPGFTSGG